MSQKEKEIETKKKAAAAEPSILELSTLSKVKPEVLEEQLSQ